jgi:esterase/lipase
MNWWSYVWRGSVLILGLLAIFPPAVRDLASHPHPATTYAGGVARARRVLAIDDTGATPGGGSIFLTHGSRTRRVYVLLHGLSDSPRQFLPLANAFYAEGANVWVPRLPDHAVRGGSASDLNRLTAEDLRDCSDASMDIAAGLGDSVIVVGLSAGGTMAAWIGQNRVEATRVLSIAPALEAALVPSVVDEHLEDLTLRLPGVTRRETTDTTNPTAEAGFNTRAIAQVFRLGLAVRKQAAKARPLGHGGIFLLNEADRTIKSATAVDLARTWAANGMHVTVYELPDSLRLPHDVVDAALREGAPDVVKDVMQELADGKAAPPWLKETVLGPATDSGIVRGESGPWVGEALTEPAAEPWTAVRPNTLPAELSDADFWKLETDISEPGGPWTSDNYTSNELEVAEEMRLLRTGHHVGGVYLGVGPEQNLSYIAAIRPQMAFICDIRRGAVMQHLMYKAIFEMVNDRADFISLLFSKPRPARIDILTPIGTIWNAFWAVPTDQAMATQGYTRIVDNLTKTHGFTFTPDESALLRQIFDAFLELGPAISTRGTAQPGGGGRGGRGGGRGGGGAADFASLTGASVDATGQVESFLSSEENFRAVKALEAKNMVVPFSGDFAGPHALRAVGAYLTAHEATVTAFYVSNVEQYLFQDGKAGAFYANVATLPLNDSSVFIRPYALRAAGEAPLCPMVSFLRANAAGRVPSNVSALQCPR